MNVHRCTSYVNYVIGVLHITMTTTLVTSWPLFCPEKCSCGLMTSSMSQQQHKTVTCDGELLGAPPTNMSDDVEALFLPSNRIRLETIANLLPYNNLSELNLVQNHIYGFEDIHTILQSVLYLNMDNNELDYLPKRSFWWVPSLHSLSVRNNKMELMHAEAFEGLADLHSLDLSGNRLCSIIPSWFKTLNNIKNLDISHNNIHILRDDIFKYSSTLERLDLSQNQLNHIHDGAFVGLTSLRILIMSDNNLKSIPLMALQKINSLIELNFNNNPLHRLDANALVNLTLNKINMSHMNHLEFIDSYAINNLLNLKVLDISHNKVLNYMDPSTFSNVPSLQTLTLRYNNLSLLEEQMLKSLPSIVNLDIEGNRLFCDCNLWWILDEYKSQTRNLSLPKARSLVCDAPAALQGKALDELDESLIPRLCAPRILPLFAQEYHIDLGDPLRLDCRAVGNPTPQTDWLLPITDPQRGDSVMVLKTSRDGGLENGQRISDHIRVSEAGTVFVDYAQDTDNGVYTCLASNPQGRDERPSRVRVTTNLASVIIIRVSQTSITITWRSRSYTHKYQILYHKHNSNQTYHIIDIEPYMRSFTANDLTPKTPYQFCIGMAQGDHSVKINCTVVVTKQEEDKKAGLFNARWYILGGGIGCVLLIVVLACTLTYFIKRYNKRKRLQEELYSDNLSQLFLASMDSMSDTTPITYENRGAEMFDDDDIDEIRSTASMPGCSTSA